MVLLDTHVLIWALSDEKGKLSDTVHTTIDNHVLKVSICSLWEIAIKTSLKDGKRRMMLSVPIKEIADICEEREIDILPVTPDDCEMLKKLPHIHGDPFDRMIIAQAMTRGLPLITKDENIWKYPGIETIW